MENRHGLAVDGCLTPPMARRARGRARHGGPVAMTRRVTLAADKGYDSRGLRRSPALAPVTPHVAQNTSNRSSAIDRRTRATLATR